MLRDITIGQFYPAQSRLHELDPRVKIVTVFLYLISLFLFRSFLGYIVVTAFLGAIIYLSHVPLKYILDKRRSYFSLAVYHYNLAGTSQCAVYDNASDLSDHRLIDVDIHNDAKPVDRWH